MGVVLQGLQAGLLNQSSAQVIDGSLKFNQISEPCLTRSLGSSGNRSTWTVSLWAKLTPTTTTYNPFFMGTTDNMQWEYETLVYANGNLYYIDYISQAGGANILLRTNDNFRDNGGWYHIVVQKVSNAGGIKLYVNNRLLDSFSSNTNNGGQSSHWNTTGATQSIGNDPGGQSTPNSQMSQFYFIDGQALGPESFGFTDGLTNTWRPKKYEGTFGTNGFYLPMDGNSPIGEDKSGNGNNWTPVNFGGSVALPKATGARPILNTDGGGNVARPGVFGSEENKTFAVTVASVGGGNRYHFDGVDRPNPTLIRGATYTFDQSNNSNSTHPLRFATAADAAGSSQYTNGVTVSKGVPGTSSTDYGGLFDGVNDYLSIPSSSDYAFGTGDFSVETWLKTNPTGIYMNCINTRGAGGTTAGWTFSVESNNTIGFYSNGHQFGASGTVTPGEWTHICVTRVSSVLRAFVNGVLIGYNGSHSQNYTNTSLSIGIHNDANGNGWYRGEMSDVRMLKGGIPSEFSTSATSLGTSVFTVNSKRTSVTNTKLLILQGSSVTTATTIATGSITNNGVSLVQFDDLYSPITRIIVPHNAPDTLYYYCTNHSGMGSSTSQITDETKADPYAWKNVLAASLVDTTTSFAYDVSNAVNSGSTTKIIVGGGAAANAAQSNFYGASSYFSGTDDRLFTTSSSELTFGTGDFTIEGWVYPAANNANKTVFSTNWGANGSILITFSHPQSPSGTGKFAIFDHTQNSGQPTVATSNAYSVNNWYHIAFVRNGTSHKFYINGIVDGSATYTASDLTRDTFIFGAVYTNGTETFNGYMQDVRVYKGVAKYTSNFVVPATSPDILPDTPSGVSGGSKLAKITDGAVSFDGSGDSLSIADNADFDFGTGDFTVELFTYNDLAQASNPVLIGATGGWYVQFKTGGTIVEFYTGSTSIQATGLGLEGGWHHIAVTKASNVVKIFIDGILKSTTSNSDTTNLASTLYIGNLNGASLHYLGFISNVRILKGTALYTANFTPPSATPLTNVTNTKLLCCQSNTSATEGAVKPGTITANGNAAATNFNPFNTDINTVRGQETGYATLNPLSTTLTLSLSNGNLDYTATSAANNECFSNIRLNGGKFYFESNLINAADVPGSTSFRFGICKNLSGSNIIIYNATGNFETLGTTDSSPPSYTAGNIIGVAVDCVNGSIQFFKDGVSVGTKTFTVGTDEWTSYIRVYKGGGNTVNGTINFGQKPFKFPPPAGFQPLNGANVRPETVITRPDHYVDVDTYTGTTPNPLERSNFSFAPDFLWFKSRAGSRDHALFDTVRGRAQGLKSNGADAQAASGATQDLVSFDNNGFTVGEIFRWSSTNRDESLVVWAWKAGGNKNTFNVDDVGYASAAAAGLTGGSITPTGSSVGTRQGFSIVKYEANLTQGATIAHGLTQKPDFAIFKNLDSGLGTNEVDWGVYHSSIGATKRLELNQTVPAEAFPGPFNNTEPTSSLFTFGGGSQGHSYLTNGPSGDDFIGYIWHDVPGLQKFGSYVGNGNANGTFVETGFRPTLLWIKNTTTNGELWCAHDSKRDPFNPAKERLELNGSGAEDDSQDARIKDFLSNGFKIRGTSGEQNTSGNIYIYCAWAEAPAFNLYGGQSNAR